MHRLLPPFPHLRHALCRALLPVAAVTLAACSLTPDYQPPALDLPPAFKESGLWKPVDPAAVPAVPDAWWTLFNDPELDRLETQAAGANATLQAAVAAFRVAQAAIATSEAALYPTLGASAGGTRSKSGSATSGTVDSAGNPIGSTGSRPRNVYTVQGTASWELDLWGRLSATVDAAQARAQASASDLAASRLSIQATVAQTYFSLRSADAQLALLDDTIAAYQRSLELTRNRYRSGVASSADVSQAETQLYSTQAQRIESSSSRAQLEHALAVLVGQAPANFSLDSTGKLPEAPALPQQLPSELLQRRPDIAAAERRVAAANAQVGVARAAFFPSLTLSASAGYRSSTFSDIISSPNLFWSFGPALAVSIFDGGARRAAVASARASVEQAAATYRGTVLTAFQEVEDNLVLGANLEQERAVQSQALASARKALDVVNNQYRSGIVSYINVVTAQSAVLSSERSLLDVRNRRLAALNTLLKNIAGRWQQG